MWRKSVKQDTYNANAAALKRCLDLSALVILSKVSRMYKSKSFGATSRTLCFFMPTQPHVMDKSIYNTRTHAPGPPMEKKQTKKTVFKLILY